MAEVAVVVVVPEEEVLLPITAPQVVQEVVAALVEGMVVPLESTVLAVEVVVVVAMEVEGEVVRRKGGIMVPATEVEVVKDMERVMVVVVAEHMLVAAAAVVVVVVVGEEVVLLRAEGTLVDMEEVKEEVVEVEVVTPVKEDMVAEVVMAVVVALDLPEEQELLDMVAVEVRVVVQEEVSTVVDMEEVKAVGLVVAVRLPAANMLVDMVEDRVVERAAVTVAMLLKATIGLSKDG